MCVWAGCEPVGRGVVYSVKIISSRRRKQRRRVGTALIRCYPCTRVISHDYGEQEQATSATRGYLSEAPPPPAEGATDTKSSQSKRRDNGNGEENTRAQRPEEKREGVRGGPGNSWCSSARK